MVRMSVKIYDVATYGELNNKAKVGDGLEHHHTPQFKPASELDPPRTRNTGVSIALTQEEHRSVHTLGTTYKGGQFEGTHRDLLVGNVRDLRNYTGGGGGTPASICLKGRAGLCIFGIREYSVNLSVFCNLPALTVSFYKHMPLALDAVIPGTEASTWSAQHWRGKHAVK